MNIEGDCQKVISNKEYSKEIPFVGVCVYFDNPGMRSKRGKNSFAVSLFLPRLDVIRALSQFTRTVK